MVRPTENVLPLLRDMEGGRNARTKIKARKERELLRDSVVHIAIQDAVT
jgi:hypothetical protein